MVQVSETALKWFHPRSFLLSGLLDNVTVLIGIAHGGKAIAGVINQPFYNYQVTPSVHTREAKPPPPDDPDRLLSLALGRI